MKNVTRQAGEGFQKQTREPGREIQENSRWMAGRLRLTNERISKFCEAEARFAELDERLQRLEDREPPAA